MRQLLLNQLVKKVWAIIAFLCVSSYAMAFSSDGFFNFYSRAITYPSGSGTVYTHFGSLYPEDEITAWEDISEAKTMDEYDLYLHFVPNEENAFFLGWAASVADAEALNFADLDPNLIPDPYGLGAENLRWNENDLVSYASKSEAYETEEEAAANPLTEPLDVRYGVFTMAKPFVSIEGVEGDGAAAGTVSINKTLNKVGDEVTVTVTPNEGYLFQGWKVVSESATSDDSYLSTATSYTFTVAGKTAMTAVFKMDEAAGINHIKADADDANAPMYDLSGKQVNNVQKGIFIQNGKKYIRK